MTFYSMKGLEESSDGEAVAELGFSEQKLIDGLRDKGIEDEGVRDLLTRWLTWVEAQEDAGSSGMDARIRVEIRKGVLYAKAGRSDAATRAFDEAYQLAQNPGCEDLMQVVIDEAASVGY